MVYVIQDTTLTAIANAIRSKTGGAEALAPGRMADAIAEIETGPALGPLGNPAGAEHIQTGYQAYGSDGQAIEGGRDFESEISNLYNQLNEAAVQLENRYQEGYGAGYSEGYAEGSGGERPLAYSWDEAALALTVTEV